MTHPGGPVRLRATVEQLDDLLVRVHRLRGAARVIIGIAGPPGTGKSTRTLDATGMRCAVAGMDGFHLAQAVQWHHYATT